MAEEPIGLYAIRQFEIVSIIPLELFGYDVSFTISSQAMLTTVIALTLYMYWATRELSILPTRPQASIEVVYVFVADTLTRFGGPEARQTLPFFFTMFVFIFFGSLFGLLPFKYTFTSQLVVTVSLALAVFAYVNFLAFRTHGLGFFRNFVPTGTPLFLAPLIIVIELISYFFRPITLGLRIFANILSGHIMLKLFGDFCVMLMDAFGTVGLAAAVFPLLFMVAMYGVEISVFLIQSYIFLVLSAIYVKDATSKH